MKLKLQYLGHLLRSADSLEKTLMLGKIEGRKRRGRHRMGWLGWHHWLSGHEFEQTQRDSEGQGSLACCSPWGHKESDTTWQLSEIKRCCIRRSWAGFCLPVFFPHSFPPVSSSWWCLCLQLIDHYGCVFNLWWATATSEMSRNFKRPGFQTLHQSIIFPLYCLFSSATKFLTALCHLLPMCSCSESLANRQLRKCWLTSKVMIASHTHCLCCWLSD